MTDVHLVETGEYSDRRIRFVTLDEAAADEWVELHNSMRTGYQDDARVHTYVLDKTIQDTYFKDYYFSVEFDPQTNYVSTDDMWGPWQVDSKTILTGPVDVLRCSPEHGVHVVGQDELLVKKVARDRINQVKAQIAGIS